MKKRFTCVLIFFTTTNLNYASADTRFSGMPADAAKNKKQNMFPLRPVFGFVLSTIVAKSGQNKQLNIEYRRLTLKFAKINII